MSGSYVTCIYCAKVNKAKMLYDAQTMDALVLSMFFECMIGKDPKTPNLSPKADIAITRMVSEGWDLPCYICAIN